MQTPTNGGSYPLLPQLLQALGRLPSKPQPKTPLPNNKTPFGQPFLGPDGKRYFKSASGHIYPVE